MDPELAAIMTKRLEELELKLPYLWTRCVEADHAMKESPLGIAATEATEEWFQCQTTINSIKQLLK